MTDKINIFQAHDEYKKRNNIVTNNASISLVVCNKATPATYELVYDTYYKRKAIKRGRE